MKPQSTPEFVVGWGTLALINAGLAQGKNRSGLNWFLTSLRLGPVATFPLVLVDREPEPKTKKSDRYFPGIRILE